MRCSIALLTILLSPHTASADIIDFESFTPGILATPVTVGDFTITTSSNAEVVSNLSATLNLGAPGATGNTTSGLIAGDGSLAMTLTITRVGGALFEFVGLDWGFDSGGASSTLLLSSNVSGNSGTFVDTIVGTGSLSDTAFSTFTAIGGPLDGQSITQLDIFFSGAIAPLAPGTFGLDNIELNLVGVSVPEPSSFALLAVGGLGFWRLRRRRQQATSPNAA